MTARKNWFSWISKTDQRQHKWAGQYLSVHGIIIPPEALKTHEAFLTWSYEFPDTSDTREMVRRMRAAWNQKKFRDQSNGKKSFSFMLPTATKKKLDDLARQQTPHISTTKMLEQLIFRDADLQETHKAELKKLKEELQQYKEEQKEKHSKEMLAHAHAVQGLAKPLVKAVMQQCQDNIQSNEEKLATRETLKDQDHELEKLFKQRASEIISSVSLDGQKLVQTHMRLAQMAYKQKPIGPAAPDKRDSCHDESNTLEAHSATAKAPQVAYGQAQDSSTED